MNKESKMRVAIALLALCFALPAFAAFDISAVMQSTTGATNCQLYLDGSAVGPPRPCGSSQSYPALIADPGVYAFTYRALNASGQSALSPVTTVSIEVIPPPEDPLSAPSVTVTCTPAPCNVVITVTPP